MKFTNQDIINELKGLHDKFDIFRDKNDTCHGDMKKEIGIIKIQTNEIHTKTKLHDKLIYAIYGVMGTVFIALLINYLRLRG